MALAYRSCLALSGVYQTPPFIADRPDSHFSIDSENACVVSLVVRFGKGLGRHKRLLADTQQPRQIVQMLHDQLSNLQQVVANGGTAREIDDALVPLISHSDPSIISPMLSLLNESGDQDGMWSILHTAESFDVAPYIAGLLRTLPPLEVSCYWWAEVLIIRVLNSEPYVAELVTQLQDEPIRTKAVVATICEKISEDPRFTAKAVSVLAAARV